MWIPESAVKSLVDNINEIIKHKPHLIGADVRENLEELKTHLEKLRQLMPNFFDYNRGTGPYLQKTVSKIRSILDGCEDTVDYVYNCCSRRRSMLNWIFLMDTYSRRYQIFKAKRQIEEAGDLVKNMNEEIMKKGYQVLHGTGDHQEIVNQDPALKVGEERVIGFDEATVEVVGLRTTGAQHLNVISVVWMLGGKTMLAKMVYMVLMSVASMILKLLDRRRWWNSGAYILRSYHCSYMYPAYIHLPNHLKPCFLYLAFFRKDSEIPVWKLLRLWISEGFILQEESGSRCLEDIAEQYLEELVHRNIVMVSKRRSNGRIRTCKMNGTFYEFCIAEAKDQNLIRKYCMHIHRRDPLLDECCRIGIDASMLDPLSRNPTKGYSTRSLLMFSGEQIEVEQEIVSCIPENFKLLKVLDADQSLFFTCLPHQLWNLVLLKYLAISGSISSLPSTLSDLWSLQTLIVRTTSPTLEIKADIWKMPHFRHVHTNASATFPSESPKDGENDNNFQTLCYISPECCKIQVFHRTRKLKKLGISGKLAELFESSLVDDLDRLAYLGNLKLVNAYNSPGRPPKIRFPKQLTKLTLSNTRLDWKEIGRIGGMENLEILKLKKYAFVGEKWKTDNGGFLRLKHLHIGHTDLMVWEASSHHFPTLRSLEINGCGDLQRVPHRLADILSLQSVRLHSSTSPGVAYSLKRIRLVKFLQTKQPHKHKIFLVSVFPAQV